jgi:anti-sigma-K factor RskA
MAGDGPQRLPEALAKQVLARAAQLDESERMKVSIPDLRTAAVEAGISSSAVDQALNEIANPQVVSTDNISARRGQSSERPIWRKVAIIAAVVIVLGVIYFSRRVVVEIPSNVPVPTTRVPPTR